MHPTVFCGMQLFIHAWDTFFWRQSPQFNSRFMVTQRYIKDSSSSRWFSARLPLRCVNTINTTIVHLAIDIYFHPPGGNVVVLIAFSILATPEVAFRQWRPFRLNMFKYQNRSKILSMASYIICAGVSYGNQLLDLLGVGILIRSCDRSHGASCTTHYVKGFTITHEPLGK